MARYKYTARRRAALRKAQLASARKRRIGRKTKIAAGVLAAGAGLVAYHKITGTGVKINRGPIPSYASAQGSRNGTFRIKSGLIGVRHQKNGRRTDITYSLKSARKVVSGSHVGSRRVVDRTTIPKYNPNSKRSWPATAYRPISDEHYEPTSQWESAVLGKKLKRRAV